MGVFDPQGIRPQREEDRKGLVLPAKCRSRNGVVHRGVISDISAKGCKLTCETLVLNPGDPVVITPDGMEGLRGDVRWTEKRVAGIAFDRPLYMPVVEHLARRHAEFLRRR